LKTKLL
nr:Chain B, Emp47p [Saccharomyces cerevisiae]